MAFPKPPPLRVKPPCPAVANKWYGAHPKHVKLVVMISTAFWTCLIAGPFFLLAVVFWHELDGMKVLKVAVAAFLLGVLYVGYSFGMLATHRIIGRGHLQEALDHQARKKAHI
ncbi:MAG: hypothetical protein WC551_01995 [Patescibacteria group bacterium]